jgi:tetratricopeptide (TPR) repeat protein
MEKTWSFRYCKPPTPDGPLVELSPKEMETRLLQQLAEAKSAPSEALWQLARFYSGNKQPDKAMDYLRQALAHMQDPEAKAGAILAMGQTREAVNDYAGAIRFYKEALGFEPCSAHTWYFIHNNLGYCFNVLNEFAEGERYCRKAITIDGMRPNAFKNLGIALRGRGELEEAAYNFIQATQVNASDRRSYDLLKALLKEHPELEFKFAGAAACCQKAVDFAGQEAAKYRPVVLRGWRRQLFLLRVKLNQLMRRFRKSSRNYMRR